MADINISTVDFVCARFPMAKCHRLESRGIIWYAITLDGEEMKLFEPSPFGGRTSTEAWNKLAQIILAIEAQTGTLRSLRHAKG